MSSPPNSTKVSAVLAAGIIVRFIDIACKVIPALGLIKNKLRIPSAHCGIHVEIIGYERTTIGSGIRIGAFSRLYIEDGGHLFLGDGVQLGRDTHIQTSGKVRIGAGTGLNDGARINGHVDIGRHCAIGPNLNVSSGEHQFRSAEPWKLIATQHSTFGPEGRPVTIGDDCWIGTHVVILPGITIGRGAIVGANAVVTKDVPAYTIVAGVPARQIGERLPFKPPTAVDARNPQDMPYFYSGFDQVGSQGDGYSCDECFTLALDAEEKTDASIELTIVSNSGGTINHEVSRQTFGVGQSILSFPVVAQTSSFHRFQCQGHCRILSATILKGDHGVAD